MANILLVHGAWHGAWCWDRLVPHLKKDGHEVRAIDLPGHGPNKKLPIRVTLSEYVRALCRAIRETDGPVTIVGHSMGGLVVTQAAECLPEKIRNVIFVAGYMPQNGESLFKLQRRNGFSIPLRDMNLNFFRVESRLHPEDASRYFYDDCPPADVEHAVERLGPQPLIPLFNEVNLSNNRFGRIPKFYVICSNDKAVTPELQMQMALRGDCDQIVEMNSAHSPFFSAPGELAAHFDRFVA